MTTIHQNKNTYLSKETVKKIDKPQTEWKIPYTQNLIKVFSPKYIVKTPTTQANTVNGQTTQIDTSKKGDI